MRVGKDTWVSLSHGIHSLKRGQGVELFVQTDRCFISIKRTACLMSIKRHPLL